MLLLQLKDCEKICMLCHSNKRRKYKNINQLNQPPPTPSLLRRGNKPNIFIGLAPSLVRRGLGVVDFCHFLISKNLFYLASELRPDKLNQHATKDIFLTTIINHF